MDFNDEQFPSETSICNMQKGYANDVSISKTNAEIADILSAINWQENSALLQDLANRAPSTNIQNYVSGLVTLNNEDEQELLGLYKIDVPRKNPILNSFRNQNFFSIFRTFVKSETSLLNNLINMLVISNSSQQDVITQILSRRLEALATLSQIQSNGFFI